MATPDPDPLHTPGLNADHTLKGGDTPPAEGGISGISHPEPPELRHPWGPRLLITLTVVLLCLVIAAVVLGLVL
ncbi:DUF6480 family protein [Streptomyces sp. TLI_171]|uniref:DUF6480 family protein n=1 Tax=Streptomyces sp. TLI_171 TaxID=1938859 RepID=UPI000C18DFD6|nr:DUF6480 family protein [Streptomyces sp. TLI_171]RKE17235.1 hypothetical protein BX266_0490 [Streptomyces sp. TLI_171]